MRGTYRAVYYALGGKKHIYADRRHLNSLMPGYMEEPFLLHEVEVFINPDGSIREIKALCRYDPDSSGYFRGHFDGLFPGQGGHGEFMSQTAAGGSVLAGGASSKVVLLGTDTLRILSPVKGKKDLVCIARPVEHSECDNAFQGLVYFAKQYHKFGETARLVSRAIVLGQSVS